MGSAATIDFQRLLQPIPGSSPTGIDLRTQNPDSHESVYWQLRSARNESGEIERKHFTDPTNAEYDLNRCRWSEIISKAVDVLAQQSKDLEVAAWLCDSLLRVQGLPASATGCGWRGSSWKNIGMGSIPASMRRAKESPPA